MARQCGGNEPYAGESRFGHDFGVRARAAQTTGKQQHGVFGVDRTRLAKFPIDIGHEWIMPDPA
jgi:hypothetical protein